MRDRCENPNSRDYGIYGGKGIEVCGRWRRFGNFLDDMDQCPDGMRLDRVDAAGNFDAQNCMWVPVSRPCKKHPLSARRDDDKRACVECHRERAREQHAKIKADPMRWAEYQDRIRTYNVPKDVSAAFAESA